MGAYTEYLDRQMSFEELSAERKAQLQRISKLRGGRDVLVFAADLNKPQAAVSAGCADNILPIKYQRDGAGRRSPAWRLTHAAQPH